MRGLIGWLSAGVAGYAGWWLGSKIGLATGVMASVVAAGLGMYAGYRWFDRNLKELQSTRFAPEFPTTVHGIRSISVKTNDIGRGQRRLGC